MFETKMKTNWIIYTLSNPRTREVRYVGWTVKTLKRRLNDHISCARRSPKTYRSRWILSLISIGLIPEIQAIEQGTGEENGLEAENRWIALFLANGVRLVNATSGGQGFTGWGTFELRSERARKSRAAMTPERRSEIARKGRASMTAEARSATARAANAAMTSETRRSNYAKREAKKTPEQRRRIVEIQAGLSPERRKEISRIGNAAAVAAIAATTTPEQRSEAASVRATLTWAKRTPAERSAIVSKSHAKRVPNKRDATGRFVLKIPRVV